MIFDKSQEKKNQPEFLNKSATCSYVLMHVPKDLRKLTLKLISEIKNLKAIIVFLNTHTLHEYADDVTDCHHLSGGIAFSGFSFMTCLDPEI